jgi:predicted nucleotidyltransferase
MMPIPEVLSAALLRLPEEVLSETEPLEVFLFGSRATGTADLRSDFDIGIRAGRRLDGREMAEIRDRLEALPILQTVDVVDFSCVSAAFESVATRDRIMIYERKA